MNLLRDVLILATLFAEIAILSQIDRKLCGTWVTPFNVLAIPYAGVTFLCYLSAPALDLVPLYTPSVLIWIVGLLLFWLGGVLISWGTVDLKWRSAATGTASKADDCAREAQLARRIACLLIPVLLYGVVVSLRTAGGWSQIGSNEFKDAYAHGLHAHAEVMASLISVLLIGGYRPRNRTTLLTIAGLCMFVVLSQVKGHVLLVICGGSLFRLFRGSMRLSLKKAAVTLVLTYIVFNAAYLIGLVFSSSAAASDSRTYSFLARHYFFYLFSGPLSLSEAVRSGTADVGGGWSAIFAPFINLYRTVLAAGPLAIAGSPHNKGMIVDLAGPTDGGDNVYTLFGTLYLYLGPLGGALYTIVAGFLCYGFLAVTKYRKNAWLTAAYCSLAAQLALGFFEIYFWYFTTYEIVGLAVLFGGYHRSRELRFSHDALQDISSIVPRVT